MKMMVMTLTVKVADSDSGAGIDTCDVSKPMNVGTMAACSL